MSYLSTDEAYDYATLACWYQNSIDETVPPIWTDEHLEELLKDFYVIPKDTPTADVAPKSEVEQLKRNLEQCENGYRQEMHLLQCKLTNANSEVERLKKKNQRLTISMNAYGLGMIRLKEQKYELAREIFAEIESEIEKFVQDARNCQEEYQSLAAKPFITLCEGKLTGLREAKQVIAELKKKHTEGESNA